MSTIYLVEHHVKGPNGESGYDIRFAWVVNCRSDAECRRVVANLPDFDSIILVTEHATIFSLTLENPVVTYVDAEAKEDWFHYWDQDKLLAVIRGMNKHLPYVEPSKRPRN